MATNEIRYVIEKCEDGSFKGDTALIQGLQDLTIGRWVYRVTKYRKSRTAKQNSLLHMYFQIIADETGNDLEKVKSAMKVLFLTTPMTDGYGNIVCNPKTGEVLTYVRDTSDLDTAEASTFTEQMRMYMMEFGMYLPLPEDQLLIKLNNQ